MVEERNKVVEDTDSLVVVMDDDSKPAGKGRLVGTGR